MDSLIIILIKSITTFITQYGKSILLMWFATTTAAYITQFFSSIRVLKDAADKGFLIDMDKLSNIEKETNQSFRNVAFHKMLIPFKNIWEVFKKANEYDKMRPSIMHTLNEFCCLIKMNPRQIKEYNSKPTTLNAFALSYNMKEELSSEGFIISVEKDNGECDSKIEFRLEENGDVIITETEGAISRLSLEEQKNGVLDNLTLIGALINIANSYYEIDDDLDDIIDNIDELDEEIDEINNDLDVVLAQREYLLDAREMLLTLKRNEFQTFNVYSSEENATRRLKIIKK